MDEHQPIPLRAIVTTRDGAALGFTDEADARDWLATIGADQWDTIWTADAYVRTAGELRADRQRGVEGGNA